MLDSGKIQRVDYSYKLLGRQKMNEYQIVIRWKSGHGPLETNNGREFHNDYDADHFSSNKHQAGEAAKFVSTLDNVIEVSVIECKSGNRWTFKQGEVSSVDLSSS